MDSQDRQVMLREMRRRLIWSLWCDIHYRDGWRSEATGRLLRAIQRLKKKQALSSQDAITED